MCIQSVKSLKEGNVPLRESLRTICTHIHLQDNIGLETFSLFFFFFYPKLWGFYDMIWLFQGKSHLGKEYPIQFAVLIVEQTIFGEIKSAFINMHPVQVLH